MLTCVMIGQYQLELLKSICEEKLCNSLEISNSVSHLVLGDMYQVCKDFIIFSSTLLPFQAYNLKRMALQFVVRNMSSVVRSKDWKDCLMDHPLLMAEVRASINHLCISPITYFLGDGGDGEEGIWRRVQ